MVSVKVNTSLTDEEKRSNVIKKLFSECPVCHKSLDDHAHWRLASVIIGPPGKNADLVAEYVAGKQWEDAVKVNEWEYDKDVREYHFILCPNDSRLGLIVAVFTYEILTNDFVESMAVLSDQDSRAIFRIVSPDRWIKLRGGRKV